MNVPNTLSVIRLVLIPVFCVLFLMGQTDSVYYIWAGAALALSGLSDMFDGFFARLLSQETELGKWLDPAADKLTLGAVCACMWVRFRDEIPELTYLLALHIAKEFIMLLGGLIVFRRRKIEGARWWGKAATVCFYTCMLAIMLLSFMLDTLPAARAMIITLAALSAAMTLHALVRYFIVGVRLLRQERAHAG